MLQSDVLAGVQKSNGGWVRVFKKGLGLKKRTTTE